MQITRSQFLRFLELRDDEGVTDAQLKIMIHCSETPIQLTPLAEACQCKAQNLTRIIKDLVKGGMLVKSGVPGNEKNKQVTLTKAGIAALKRIFKIT